MPKKTFLTAIAACLLSAACGPVSTFTVDPACPAIVHAAALEAGQDAGLMPLDWPQGDIAVRCSEPTGNDIRPKGGSVWIEQTGDAPADEIYGALFEALDSFNIHTEGL